MCCVKGVSFVLHEGVRAVAGVNHPGEVKTNVVPVLNLHVNEFSVVGRVHVAVRVDSDLDHVLAGGWRPGDVATASGVLKGVLAAAEEGSGCERVNGGIEVALCSVVAHGEGVFPDQIVSVGVFGNTTDRLAGVGEVDGHCVAHLEDVRIALVLDEGGEGDLLAHL